MSRTPLFWGGLILTALIVIGLYILSSPPPSPHGSLLTRSISVDGVPVRVKIADTDAVRMLGLSGHKPLQPDEGMLFVFDTEGTYAFWMKDMLFSLDILWLDGTGRIVHIEEDVSPETYPASFTSDSPARYVLEVPAGFADQHDIQIGEKANLGE